MSKVSDKRTPWPELILLALGVAVGLTAGELDYDGVGTVCAWACAFSVVAVLVTVFLSPFGSALQMIAIGIGSVAAIYAIRWYQQHQNEPYIFSPVLVGYVGGGLALSGFITIVYRSITHPDRANSI